MSDHSEQPAANTGATIAIFVPILASSCALMLVLGRDRSHEPFATAETWWGVATGVVFALAAVGVGRYLARRKGSDA